MAPPSQAQWEMAQLLCLSFPLSVFHTHKAPLKLKAHQIFTYLPSCLHNMWWDLFNPLPHGFPSYHNSTLDSKSGLGNLGVGNHPLSLLVPICVFWSVTPAFESFDFVSYLALQKWDIQQCHILISPYILTWVHTWAKGTGHTSVTYFCLWLLPYQFFWIPCPLFLVKIFLLHTHKTPSSLRFLQRKT